MTRYEVSGLRQKMAWEEIFCLEQRIRLKEEEARLAYGCGCSVDHAVCILRIGKEAEANAKHGRHCFLLKNKRNHFRSMCCINIGTSASAPCNCIWGKKACPPHLQQGLETA